MILVRKLWLYYVVVWESESVLGIRGHAVEADMIRWWFASSFPSAQNYALCPVLSGLAFAAGVKQAAKYAGSCVWVLQPMCCCISVQSLRCQVSAPRVRALKWFFPPLFPRCNFSQRTESGACFRMRWPPSSSHEYGLCGHYEAGRHRIIHALLPRQRGGTLPRLGSQRKMVVYCLWAWAKCLPLSVRYKILLLVFISCLSLLPCDASRSPSPPGCLF